jgi:hypothetical protein
VAVAVGEVVRAVVVSADVERQQVWVTLSTGPTVFLQIRGDRVRDVARWAGVLQRQRDEANLKGLHPADRAEIPARLAKAAADLTWLNWAKLRLDRPNETALIIGPRGAARYDIQNETGACMAADAGDVYLLAPTAAAIEAAIDGIRRRLAGKCGVTVEKFHTGDPTAPADDPYGPARRAPVGHVATVPDQALPGPAEVGSTIRQRLRALRDQFGRGGPLAGWFSGSSG